MDMKILSQSLNPRIPCSTRHRRVAIDLVPIRVGEGGTGSGIWTYARELLCHMDRLDFHDLEIVLLVNKGQRRFLSGLHNFYVLEVPVAGKNIFFRVLWVHLLLPLVCLFKRIDVLHKLATETPLFCSVKRVTTVHDFYYEFLLEQRPPESIRLYERLENFYFSFVTKLCFSKSRMIIAVSDATRQEAIGRYPEAADRVHVVHHGSFLATRSEAQIILRSKIVSKARFKERKGSQNSNDQERGTKHHQDVFNILCVAKFMEHKGQHLLVDAFEALLEGSPGLSEKAHLNLRGFHNDEVYYGMICRQVSESRFAGNIHLIPFNADESTEEIYANADLVVLLSSYEGFGLPVLEAQGKGIPVLCSSLPVLQEVGGAGAAYVSRTDKQSIVDSMRQFIVDVEYRDGMREKATENLKRFSWETAATKTLGIYCAVCGVD